MPSRSLRLNYLFSEEIKQVKVVDIADKFREIIGDSFQDAFRRKVKKLISDRLEITTYSNCNHHYLR